MDGAVNKGFLSTEKTESLLPKTRGSELNPLGLARKSRSNVSNRREPEKSEVFGMLGLQREGKSAAVNRIGTKHFHNKMFGSPNIGVSKRLSKSQVADYKKAGFESESSHLRQLPSQLHERFEPSPNATLRPRYIWK